MLRHTMLFRGCARAGVAGVAPGTWVYGYVTRQPWSDEVMIQDPVSDVTVPVSSYTVDQFTGLRLADGTPVFEGDILDTGPGTPRMTVGWDDERAAFMIRRGGTRTWRRLDEWMRVARREARRVGTLFDGDTPPAGEEDGRS